MEDEDLEIVKLRDARHLAETGTLYDQDYINNQITAKGQSQVAETGSGISPSSSDNNDTGDSDATEGGDDFGMDDFSVDETEGNPATEEGGQEDASESDKGEEDPDAAGEDAKEVKSEADADPADAELSEEAANLRCLSLLSYADSGDSTEYNRGIIGTLKDLALAGFDLGAKAASGLYKGVVYAVATIAKAHIHVTKVINDYKRDRAASVKKLSGQLADARKLASKLQLTVDSHPDDPGYYTKADVANALSLSGGTDVTKNLVYYKKTLDAVMASLVEAVRKEIMIIEDKAASKRKGTYVPLVETPYLPRGFVKETSNAYGVVAEGCQLYRYQQPYLSNIVLLLAVPVVDKSKYHEALLSFKKARTMMVPDRKLYKPVDRLNYMTLGGVTELLDAVEGLIVSLAHQQKYYDTILNDKARAQSVIRHYVHSLSEASEMVGIQESEVTQISIRNQYVDDTYLVAMMDSQTLCAKTISLALDYARENLKRLM